jgi:hypothetical protein
VKPLEDLPTSFWCLMTKGEKSRLKLKGLSSVFICSVLSGKTRLFGFAQQNFSLFFSVSISCGLENFVIYETQCFVACNNS